MHQHELNHRLDRLERAVSLILRVLAIEERQIDRIEDQLKPHHYPATVGIKVKPV